MVQEGISGKAWWSGPLIKVSQIQISEPYIAGASMNGIKDNGQGSDFVALLRSYFCVGGHY